MNVSARYASDGTLVDVVPYWDHYADLAMVRLVLRRGGMGPQEETLHTRVESFGWSREQRRAHFEKAYGKAR